MSMQADLGERQDSAWTEYQFEAPFINAKLRPQQLLDLDYMDHPKLIIIHIRT